MLFLAVLFLVDLASGQEAIFAGRVVDEYENPVAGARVKVSYSWNYLDEVQTDNDGLYYTKLLPGCVYYHVDVVARGKRAKAGKVYLKAADNTKWYYNLKVIEDKAYVLVTEHSPFMATEFSRVEREQRNIDLPMRVMVVSREEDSVWRAKRGGAVAPTAADKPVGGVK